MINLLHISDLHFTSERTGLRRDYSFAASQAIISLAQELRNEGALGENLYVAITGDLVQSGEIKTDGGCNDFEAVQTEFLAPLLQTLNLTPNEVFIVPGNHEMDRSAVDESDRLVAYKLCSEAECHDDLRAKLGGFFDFVEKHGYRSVTRDNPRIAFFDVDGQQIACLNGLVGSYSRQGLDDKGHLFHLPTEMAGCLGRIRDFGIILTHHPMSWYSDESELTLRDFLARRRCRVLSGHIHRQSLGETKTQAGSYLTLQAGASSESGSSKFAVGVVWLPNSNSAAFRHFEFDESLASFSRVAPVDTIVAPKSARSFFERSEAFFDPTIVSKIAGQAKVQNANDLQSYSGVPIQAYIPPDIMVFPDDQFSGKRTTVDALEDPEHNVCVSGFELSGKSSLITYLSYRLNADTEEKLGKIGLTLDFRELIKTTDISELIVKKISELGASNQQANYLLSIGKVRLFVDNVDPNESRTLRDFFAFLKLNPATRWTVASRGSERYMPSRSPAEFSAHQPQYFQTSDTTLPTVLKMIDNHRDAANTDKPRHVVEKVFRSIQNISAPRSMFYVRSMLDIFLSDASVEPLNRYLLIENMISDRLRAAHRDVFPGQPVDTQMLDALVGQFAYELLERRAQLATKAQFLTLVEEFIERKGIQRKRFEPEKVLDTLLQANVLRSYAGGYGFIILSVEDYFLAKHMNQDAKFRDSVLSEEGLLTLPGVAEYYVAQNPNDRPRIEKIFGIIRDFEDEVSPLIAEISESAVAAIQSAAPGKDLNLQQELLDDLALVDDADEASMIEFSAPETFGKTQRVKYSIEERGAVLLQLGASVLGVTRTLDQEERVEIFGRLRNLLLICIKAVPMIAHHLADGHELRFRGVTMKAEYTGQLKVQEDRYYILLRGILHSMFKNFSTWAGSPSFFNSAVALRKAEDDEFILTALYAQNIEADLSEALDYVTDVTTDIDSLVLREIVARLFVDAMTLVPLEREIEAKGVDRLVDLTAEIDPPANSQSADQMKRHKDRLRRYFSEKIGINTYVGKRLLPRGGKKTK